MRTLIRSEVIDSSDHLNSRHGVLHFYDATRLTLAVGIEYDFMVAVIWPQ